AMSIAALYATPEQARAEGERLFASNSEPDPGVTADLVEVPGASDVNAVVLSGKEDGRPFTGIEVVFVDGPVLHEVFAFAPDAMVDTDAVLASVVALHDEVAGHPLLG
ncbi:MAG: hypothetical protein WB767_07810, partial [Nocardioides sp.]